MHTSVSAADLIFGGSVVNFEKDFLDLFDLLEVPQKFTRLHLNIF